MSSESVMTLGERIQSEMRRKRMSMRALAKLIDTTQPTVFKWIHDMSEPPLKALKKMVEIFNVSPVWLMYGDEDSAGQQTPAAMIISEDGMKYVDSPARLYYPVKSDEMAPTLVVGDTAVVDRNVQTIDQAGIYLVKVSGESLLRRFRRALDGSIRVSCDNSSKYPEVETLGAKNDIEVLGRVVLKVSVERVD